MGRQEILVVMAGPRKQIRRRTTIDRDHLEKRAAAKIRKDCNLGRFASALTSGTLI